MNRRKHGAVVVQAKQAFLKHNREQARRFFRPQCESLEDRRLMAFSVLNGDLYSTGGLRLVVDLNQTVNISTLQASDVLFDGTTPATAVNVVDADTVSFTLPTLAAGAHTATIAAGSFADNTALGIDAYTKNFNLASAAQFVVKHNPRLQPGNAPLVGFAGSELDRVDILWQTMPAAGAGAQDSFTVEYRAAGSNAAWQSASLNAAIDTTVQGRVVRSASVTGLNSIPFIFS